MLQGCDISEHNGDLTIDWFKQWQFVIIRVSTEWNSRLDYKFQQNWNNCAAAGIPRGAYGWPQKGRDNAALGKQLVAAAPGAECGYWADYETSDAGLCSTSELEDYVRACDGGFYSNLSELRRSAYLDSRPWWFANPSGNPPPRSWLIEQYKVTNLDYNRAYESLLSNGETLTADEHRWLQSIYIRLGGDNGMGEKSGIGNSVFHTVEDITVANKPGN
jgi:hypothetical protein